MDKDFEKDDSGASTLGGLGRPADVDVEKGLEQQRPLSPPSPASSSSSQRQGVEHLEQQQGQQSADRKVLSDTTNGKPGTHADRIPEFLVRFAPDDPEDPHNLSNFRRTFMTFVLGMLAFCGSMGSSIVTPAESAIATDLDMSYEETVLLMSLFVLGFALGPLLWAPVSEAYGRRWSILPAVCTMALFSIGSATSKTPAALLATRFLGGVFGSAPISNVTAALGDFYLPAERGVAMAFYSVCVIGGPCLAPVFGAAITNNPHMGWRWTQYIQAIITFFVVTVAFVSLPETYGPVLLDRKAKALRASTGDDRWWHPHEFDRVTIQTVVTKHLSRPLRMFFTEPIVTCVALYASFVYGLIFMALEVYPIVFRDDRHYGPIVASLPFIALFVGAASAVAVNVANQPLYAKAVARNGGRAAPEARLPPIILGGVLFTAGLFWFGWTAAPRYHWALPTVAGGLIGAGFNIVFQQCMNYLVDSYGRYAASATSANTVLRSFIACGLPLAAKPMFNNMGVGPAASVLGGISCLALPVPFLFMRYGPKLRAMSKFVE